MTSFCLIWYFFEDNEGIKKFHAQWFMHSSKTLLQEVGHSHALYLMLSDCSDVEVEAISQKCNVHELAKDSFQPDESTLEEDNNFHFGFSHGGVNYHVSDFAYISMGDNNVYQIGSDQDNKILQIDCCTCVPTPLQLLTQGINLPLRIVVVVNLKLPPTSNAIQ
ncbi:hypothetical protein DFJ58DRAFT_841089 [Suillus subalutaceus]|uniref:uncharacterized protein n=1 Tax=Suillus subalutaceus TaxID=48586 RepID=UPI001B85C86B|nr:uncharacterized protein DFJ58DRAFT_841089 [Suillus subalutaceus]KAG1855661.1 hypothetical protein DFJ58DRAFT_841089 [Suillus subalutaceus]